MLINKNLQQRPPNVLEGIYLFTKTEKASLCALAALFRSHFLYPSFEGRKVAATAIAKIMIYQLNFYHPFNFQLTNR